MATVVCPVGEVPSVGGGQNEEASWFEKSCQEINVTGLVFYVLDHFLADHDIETLVHALQMGKIGRDKPDVGVAGFRLLDREG